MTKKLIFCIFVFFTLFNYGLSNGDSDKSSSTNNIDSTEDSDTKDGNIFDSIIVKPVTNVGIGITSIAMAPIGAFVGVFEGVAKTEAILYNGEHHSGDSDIVNIVVAPLAAVGFAVGDAGYMAYKLPQKTAEYLSKSDDN
ncbi:MULTISPECIES: hypothetical protein [unclassified Francisella]|uniref:hypothetical protein n=1 Tax=unclassified Francisella TaxID=2610885 RepID=UPI002E333A7B|nr:MULTISPECIES: hypothetical protein [unclassified Francisella]MED7818328.1 hypothetical protein [Francisella sp. 19S2-4]MED7829164.1 hypothetical protein [Francisella sp. 19S2-10]